MPTPALEADPMVPRLVRLRALTWETPDTATLELDPEAEAPAAAPGQFHMLYVFGVGEVPISVAGRAQPGRGALHTVRAVGAVTRALTLLEPGMQLGLRGPFGFGWPLDRCAGRDVLVIAGGLGLPPLMGAVEALLAGRPRARRLAVLVGARSPETLIYADVLDAWSRAQALELQVTVDHAGPDWRGHVGVVTELLKRVRFDPAGTVALVCGPEVMLRFAAGAAVARGVPAAQVFVSLERNMKCATGHCGHCQLGPVYVCKDGPVLSWDRVRPLLLAEEV